MERLASKLQMLLNTPNEPGFYIPAEGFGIRLEDDYVIQKEGNPFNLMQNIPLEAEEIEDLMNK